MPRPKTITDEMVLDSALALMHREGRQSLTFAALAKACGLSGSTLVQRFISKDALAKAALLHAWDRLDAETAEAVATAPKSPEGAVQILVQLSDYGDIDRYADGLSMLREDIRDPELRSRGASWGRALAKAINDCFDAGPESPSNMGELMIVQWQGLLLWWSFEPVEPVRDYTRRKLSRLLNDFDQARAIRSNGSSLPTGAV